jgi:hypothetical protein
MHTGMIGPRVTRPRSPLPAVAEAAPVATTTTAVTNKRERLMPEW